MASYEIMLPDMINFWLEKNFLVMNEPPPCETFADGVADELKNFLKVFNSYVRRHRQYGLYLLRVCYMTQRMGKYERNAHSWSLVDQLSFGNAGQPHHNS